MADCSANHAFTDEQVKDACRAADEHGYYVSLDAMRAALEAADRAAWLPVDQLKSDEFPEFAIVAYEDGFVTAAEYSERLEGGPDDHQTWVNWLAGDESSPEYHDRLMGYAWPSYMRPLPVAPRSELARSDVYYGA